MKLVWLLFPILLLLNGCFGVSEEFRSYQKDLIGPSAPSQEEEFEISLGRVQLYFAEKLVGIFDRDLLTQMIIHDVSKVELGVYRTTGNPDENSGSVQNSLVQKGWQKFMFSKEGNDEVTIFLKVNDESDRIRDLLFLVSEDEEQVLIKIEGNFNRIIERLIKARKIALR